MGSTVSFSRYTDPSINNPDAITTGPDGALWFPNWLGGIRRANHDDRSNVAVDGGDEWQSITPGPYGALWMDGQTDSMGKITTDGVIAGFSDPSFGPSQIADGDNGALWFTNTVQSIGQITTIGDITNYTSPDIQSPNGITNGPDGYSLVPRFSANSIGRISTSGVVTDLDRPDDRRIKRPGGVLSRGIRKGAVISSGVHELGH